MKHTEIDNATFRNVGGEQGYVGISVRLGIIDCPVNGPATPIVEMALLPTPEELTALNEGRPLIVRQIGTQVVPFAVYVDGLKYPGEAEET